MCKRAIFGTAGLVATGLAVLSLTILHLAPYHLKPTPWLTAGDIEERIEQVGARRTVNELMADDAWDFVLEQIGQGRPEWLRLVPRLTPAVDGDSAETLRDHLGLALPRNAAGVLAVLDPHNGSVAGVDSVCSTAFGNNLERPPPGADLARRAWAAVSAIKDPKLQSAKARCSIVLRRGVCTVCGG